MILPPPNHHDPVNLSCCTHSRAERLEQAAREIRDESLKRLRVEYTSRWRPWREDEPTIPYARDVLSIVLGLGVVSAIVLSLMGCAPPPEVAPEPDHTAWAQGLLSPEGGWLSVEIDATRVHLSCPAGATSTRRILEIEITGNEFTTRPGRIPLALPCEVQIFAPWPVTVDDAQIRRLTETTIVIERVELGRTYEMRRMR